jgi:hypothetical protein
MSPVARAIRAGAGTVRVKAGRLVAVLDVGQDAVVQGSAVGGAVVGEVPADGQVQVPALGPLTWMASALNSISGLRWATMSSDAAWTWVPKLPVRSSVAAERNSHLQVPFSEP